MSTSAPVGVPLGSRMLDVTGLRSTRRRERYSPRAMFFREALGLPVLRVALRFPVMLRLAVTLGLTRPFPRLDGRAWLHAYCCPAAAEDAAVLTGRRRGDTAGL
jgi:hypothetical protein